METEGLDKKDLGKLISLSEAAKYLHVSYTTVFRLVRDGELEAFRIKNTYFFVLKKCSGGPKVVPTAKKN